MREESDDIGAAFEPLFEFVDRLQRLARVGVQIEDHQRGIRGAILPRLVRLFELIEDFPFGFRELDFDVQLARGLLDLCQEEKVVNEGEDERLWSISIVDRLDLGMLEEALRLLPATSTLAPTLIALITVLIGIAVAMVHGAGKNARLAIAAPTATAAARATTAGALLLTLLS